MGQEDNLHSKPSMLVSWQTLHVPAVPCLPQLSCMCCLRVDTDTLDPF